MCGVGQILCQNGTISVYHLQLFQRISQRSQLGISHWNCSRVNFVGIYTELSDFLQELVLEEIQKFQRLLISPEFDCSILVFCLMNILVFHFLRSFETFHFEVFEFLLLFQGFSGVMIGEYLRILKIDLQTITIFEFFHFR